MRAPVRSAAHRHSSRDRTTLSASTTTTTLGHPVSSLLRLLFGRNTCGNGQLRLHDHHLMALPYPRLRCHFHQRLSGNCRRSPHGTDSSRRPLLRAEASPDPLPRRSLSPSTCRRSFGCPAIPLHCRTPSPRSPAVPRRAVPTPPAQAPLTDLATVARPPRLSSMVQRPACRGRRSLWQCLPHRQDRDDGAPHRAQRRHQQLRRLGLGHRLRS